MDSSKELKITLIQSSLHWHSIEANLAMFEEKVWKIEEGTDLIILPEMFNTGFTMEVESLAEPMNSKTFRWMRQQAAQTKAVVAGSLIIREGSSYFNRLIWMGPDGSYATYDKRHLFRMAGEHHSFDAGDDILIKQIKDWKICPMVCYDLRFPVWSRNKWDKEMQGMKYDLLIFIANWPAVRVSAWDILLKARAVENLCYVAGVNRIGEDGNDIDYNGHSAVINTKGQYLWYGQEKEQIKTVKLDKDELDRYREKFPAYLDADDFEIKKPVAEKENK